MIKHLIIGLILTVSNIGWTQVEKLGDKIAMTETAIFAMGCFWCGESEFRDHDSNLLPGILNIRVGYAGGTTPNPTYENHEGYKEAVKITYDPTQISYATLLDIFWKNIDPFDNLGQFCDKGFAYTAVIFYTTEPEKTEALQSKAFIQNQFKPQTVFTDIIRSTSFYDAEEYHQNYKSKNPIRYKYYRWNCGRDNRLKVLWSGR